MTKPYRQDADMTFWGEPYQADDDREPSFFWHDSAATTPGGGDGSGADDANDLFSQFVVDYDDTHVLGGPPHGFMGMGMGMGLSIDGAQASTEVVDKGGQGMTVPRLDDPYLIDPPSDSLGSSTADEIDFLSSSTDVDHVGSSVYDVDPRTLAPASNGGEEEGDEGDEGDALASGGAGEEHHHHHHHHPPHHPPPPLDQHYFGGASISDTDLPHLEDITLSSPTKAVFPSSAAAAALLSQPPSPPLQPPSKSAAARKASRFVEAVGATIRKATGGGGMRKKSRKPLPETRPGSPSFDDEIKTMPRQRPRQTNSSNSNSTCRVRTPASGQTIRQQQQHHHTSGKFIVGPCDDPFNDAPPLPPPSHSNRRFTSPPLVSPGIKSEAGSFHLDNVPSHVSAQEAAAWQHQQQQQQQPPPGTAITTNGHWDGTQMVPGPDSGTPVSANGWWDYQMMMAQQNGAGFIDQKTASEMNLAALHAQHSEQLPFEYAQPPPPFQDTASSGLMIHVPHPQAALGDMNPSPHTQLPPHIPSLPPPPPAPVGGDRQNRPPRAPSSGARHLSNSPVRRTRAPSASPTRTHPGHTRHSSNGSVSSMRSTSGGRLPASMPGTPCSVRKRRSREPSGSNSGSGGGTGEVGFVNFTPHDGGMLMTGVAPSGSSKTKARREKEAADRRKKMNEAAIRAVAAAGGDVERLMEQGFAF
jgi:hypothetical protein